MSESAELVFRADLPVCPVLPLIDQPIRATVLREFGRNRGPEFYLRALQCAQSLWRRGLPAQALLLINRALGADLKGNEPILAEWPLPYAAATWILQHRDEASFLGNPRRHYQHLATRMVEPRKEQRVWRAWGCWALACIIGPEWPADEVQLAKEPVSEPTLQDIFEKLSTHGLPGEAVGWKTVLDSIADGPS